jgi:hypothetical protein
MKYRIAYLNLNLDVACVDLLGERDEVIGGFSFRGLELTCDEEGLADREIIIEVEPGLFFRAIETAAHVPSGIKREHVVEAARVVMQVSMIG